MHTCTLPCLVLSSILLVGPAASQVPDPSAEPDSGLYGGASQTQRQIAQQTLQSTLVDLIALRHQVQQAHWNIVGPDFYQLHDLTGHFYERLNGLIDRVAEQKVIRGAAATGGPGAVAAGEGLPALPSGFLDSVQLLASLSKSYAALSSQLGQRIEKLGEAGDLPSQDLLVEVATVTDKHLWMLRAHAQQTAAGDR